jgi:hypothetical protein
MILMTVGLALVGMTSGCLVRETVNDNGEVISDRYKLEEPLHSRTTPY